MNIVATQMIVDTPRGAVEISIRIRPNTSDLAACQQVFGSLDYDLRRLKRYQEISSIYETLTRDGRTPLVVDLGANIGTAALYFACAWPSCHVLSVEPAADNFQLLFENTQDCDNITAWHAAVASAAGRMRVANPTAEKWAYRTAPAAEGEDETVAAVTVASILKEFSAQKGYEPFIIKIDIEGAEADLFRTATEWIERFPILIIELHDWMLCGQASSANFLRAIAPLQRDFVYIGENVFSITNSRQPR
jgi:FkbM family methyltransferase